MADEGRFMAGWLGWVCGSLTTGVGTATGVYTGVQSPLLVGVLLIPLYWLLYTEITGDMDE